MVYSFVRNPKKIAMGNTNASIVDKDKACPFIQKNTGELLEYSVVYTDRAINLMSAPFQQCMKDISAVMKELYHAQHVAIIPGSGSYAMEAVARQFGTNKKCLVIRNGFFSFRWSDIFDVCKIPSEETVLKAKAEDNSNEPIMNPAPIDDVVAAIRSKKPNVVFAPHVETATGILLHDEYLKKVAAAVHEVGGIFVLDAIAAGSLWCNMESIGVDVLITAPQKGLSGPACCGIVMMNDTAKKICNETTSTSFTCNLRKWSEVMEAYEKGGFMYYTTMPTDALMAFREVIFELRDTIGFEQATKSAQELGKSIRTIMANNGLKSVASDEFASPTVVVCYAKSADIAARFKAHGLQIAGGVPFKCDEPANLITFRIGLFGIDKLRDSEKCCETFAAALRQVLRS